MPTSRRRTSEALFRVAGVIFVLLGRLRLLDVAARAFPKALIRGVQLTVGLLFLKIAWGLVLDPPKSFADHALPSGWADSVLKRVASEGTPCCTMRDVGRPRGKKGLAVSWEGRRDGVAVWLLRLESVRTSVSARASTVRLPSATRR